jgi:hypothetical protein
MGIDVKTLLTSINSRRAPWVGVGWRTICACTSKNTLHSIRLCLTHRWHQQSTKCVGPWWKWGRGLLTSCGLVEQRAGGEMSICSDDKRFSGQREARMESGGSWFCACEVLREPGRVSLGLQGWIFPMTSAINILKMLGICCYLDKDTLLVMILYSLSVFLCYVLLLS